MRSSLAPGEGRRPLGRAGRYAVLASSTALVALPLVIAVYAGTFTPNATQPPLAHAMIDPGVCEGCHGDFNPNANIEPFPTWAGSMMANAGRDPLFWAALDVANHDVPGVGSYCLRCHAPFGYLAGRVEAPGGTPDGCALEGSIDLPDNDFEGVACHLCHRMMVNSSPPVGEQTVYTENGQYWLDDADCPTGSGSGPCRRGPYNYPGGGDVPPPHEWAFSAYHTEATICGNCHNVTSPGEMLIDGTGTDTGVPYPIERTFKEWQQSDYALVSGQTTCQGCHMPDATENPAHACAAEQNNRTGNMPVHRFVGGNTWVPAVLRDEYPNLQRTAEYNATIAAATSNLQNNAAVVEVTAPAVVQPEDTLEVSVKVTNLTGHKLPTGYTEGRRMWINVEARDASNELIWQSGAYNTSTGVLTEDAQIKVYHLEPGIWNHNGTNQCDITDGGGNPIFHFVLNNCIAVDNRIPPLGFTGAADLETRPVNYSYPETSPGSGKLVNYDTTTYEIQIPPLTVSPVTVQARLYFQVASNDYVEFLRDQAVTFDFPNDCIPRSGGTPALSRGEILYDLWTEYGRIAPVSMALDSSSVVVDNDIFADGFESGNTSAWTSTFP